MNTDEKLVYMANQIAANFVAMHSADPAAAAADHIAKYWDPGMKRRIFALVGDGAKGLEPLAETAVRSLIEAGAPYGRALGKSGQSG
jgi:formate dehydrogenase subunit delta